MPSDPSPQAKGAPQAAEKFVIPEDWRVRCEITRISPVNRSEYIPLHMDLIKCLNEVREADVIFYIMVGWELVEFIRPADFTKDLVKEMFEIVKKYPSYTRIVIRRQDYPRYERLASAYRSKRFEAASSGAAMVHMPSFICYTELSNASQMVGRGAITEDLIAQVSAGVSSALTKLPLTRNLVHFVVQVCGKDPVLYDHGAITALIALAICWNSLQLTKRDTKLCGQSALFHDVERNCAYLFKPAVPMRISEASVKDLVLLKEKKGAGIHGSVIQTMQQFRERFEGGGFPSGLKGAAEDQGDLGIVKFARIVAISCAFSEYLLKRKEKLPLSFSEIVAFMQQRIPSEFDPKIFDAFLKDYELGQARKAPEKSMSMDDEFDVD